jgi:hypothetical protein
VGAERDATWPPDGVIAGAAIGAMPAAPMGFQVAVQTQRCTTVPGQARLAYWDVTYNFRGQEYRVQLASPPRRDRDGERARRAQA